MQQPETTTNRNNNLAANSEPSNLHQRNSRMHLRTEHRQRLEAMIRTGYPHETCGVLIGRQADGVVEIQDLVQAGNLNQERAEDRFELNPNDFLAADQAARKQGLEIVGIWHSHPDHPAEPSATDLVNAWEGWSYLIASISQNGMEDLRSWRLHAGQFLEESIEP